MKLKVTTVGGTGLCVAIVVNRLRHWVFVRLSCRTMRFVMVINRLRSAGWTAVVNGPVWPEYFTQVSPRSRPKARIGI